MPFKNQLIPPNQKLIRLPEVKERVGLSRSSIYLRISEGMFPKPINLGGRAVGWDSCAIDKWIQERIAASQEV